MLAFALHRSSRPPPAYSHLPRSATHHGAVAFPGLPQATKGGVFAENSIQEGTEKSSRAFSSAEGLPAVSSSSSPSQVVLQCSPGFGYFVVVISPSCASLVPPVATSYLFFYLSFDFFFIFFFLMCKILSDFLFSPSIKNREI